MKFNYISRGGKWRSVLLASLNYSVCWAMLEKEKMHVYVISGSFMTVVSTEMGRMKF